MARILVIDDDPNILRAVDRVLTAEGHEVRTAANGQDALRWFAGDPADLVITDIYMPEMDGMELMVKLRETFPETPIIAMSGGTSFMSSKLALDVSHILGAVVTLPKPFTADTILKSVAEALAGRDRQ